MELQLVKLIDRLMICCFQWALMMTLSFGLLVGQKKRFVDVTFSQFSDILRSINGKYNG